MTRDSIPRDDLYGELEVSRQASVAAIEAAYRRLVKQHHPDVARSDDFERIKRLNLAREWLTDLDRRRRYDVSRGFTPTSMTAHLPGSPGWATSPTSTEPARSFGPNANDVRIFLAGLRGLDSARARRVFDGRAVAHAQGYSVARSAAAQIGMAKRKTEWQLAREAASVIARGKLGDTTLTEQVVDVLADAAGAIAIRDLLSRSYYKTLLLPWTWRSARVEPAAAPEPRAPTVEARAAPRQLAHSAPEAVPEGRWAEAFGTRWPPPGGRVVPADVMAPVAIEPAISSPAPARVVEIAPAAAASFEPAGVATPPAAAVANAASVAMPAAVATESPRQPIASEPVPVVVPPTPVVSTPPPAAKAPDPITSPISIADLGASPWTAPIEPDPKLVKARSVRGAVTRTDPRLAGRRPGWIAAVAALLVVIAIAGVIAALGRPPSELEVAAITDDPLSPSSEATGFVVAPGESDAATTEPTSTDLDPTTPRPVVTDRPGAGPTPDPPPPGPGQTPKPTPKPTKTPGPTPPGATPTPAPTPAPTPTPEPNCTVPDLIGQRVSAAQNLWTGAGFTGPFTVASVIPPGHEIVSQNIPAGTDVACSTGITVDD